MSDRSEAIIAGSLLENTLEYLIRQHLINNDPLLNSFFKGKGALSSFATKIDMAVLLGILDDESARIFHTIRRIRNDFAHNVRPLNFGSQGINALCDNLVHTGDLQIDEATVSTDIPSDQTARTRYLGTVMFYVAAMALKQHLRELPDVRPASPDISERPRPLAPQTENRIPRKRVRPPRSSPQ